jgi:endoglucanase
VIHVPQPSLGWHRAVALGAAAVLTPLALAGPGRADTAAPTTANLLTGDTASLAQSVGAWKGRTASLSLPVTGVLGITSAASASYVAAVTATGVTPAIPDRVYTGTISVRAASQPRKVAPTLQFFAADGTLLTSVQGRSVTEATSTWAVQQVVAIAPPNAASVVVGEVVGSPAAGEVHFLRQPTLTVAPVSRRDVVGPLHVVGNKIVDANGPVILRGIHRRGLESSGLGVPSTAEIAQAKRWGATMIRLSVSSAYWNEGSCSYKPDYATMVDQAVAAVTSMAMVALVDLHTNSVVCGVVKQQYMADSTALKFWRSVASRYAGNSLVAFDLYNEPHDISDSVWRDGGRVLSGGVLWTAVGMQDMYDVVRGAGANNLVFVSGNDWANRLPGTLYGKDIVYGVHAYTCPTSTDPSQCAPNPLDPSQILRHYDAISATAPVVITEFGWPSSSDGRYSANVVSYAVSHGWGWISFSWDGRTDGKFGLLSSTGTLYEPSPTGMSILAGLNPSS